MSSKAATDTALAATASSTSAGGNGGNEDATEVVHAIATTGGTDDQTLGATGMADKITGSVSPPNDTAAGPGGVVTDAAVSTTANITGERNDEGVPRGDRSAELTDGT